MLWSVKPELVTQPAACGLQQQFLIDGGSIFMYLPDLRYETETNTLCQKKVQ